MWGRVGMGEYREGVKMQSFCKRRARESWARWKAAATRLSAKTICAYAELDGKLTCCARVSKAREKISRTEKPRCTAAVWRTVANCGEPWQFVSPTNRTVASRCGSWGEPNRGGCARFGLWANRTARFAVRTVVNTMQASSPLDSFP